MKLEDMNARQRVRLTQEIKTPKMTHAQGGIYRVLSFHGTLVRLSRASDRAKLITHPSYLEAAPPDPMVEIAYQVFAGRSQRLVGKRKTVPRAKLDREIEKLVAAGARDIRTRDEPSAAEYADACEDPSISY